jgi:Tfp pilus assembly protein PilW
MKLSGFTTILALLALVPAIAIGQTTINTGALTGVVRDTSGGVLPGVTVTVSSPNLQGMRSAVTDGQGIYVVPLLPPGKYHAEYALSGVKSEIRDVVISAGQSTKVDVNLKLAVTETLTVTASQVVVDTTQTQQQTTLKEDHLKYTSVGSLNRSFQSAIGQVAEAYGTGNANVVGANINSNTFMIDGINALTDPDLTIQEEICRKRVNY